MRFELSERFGGAQVRALVDGLTEAVDQQLRTNKMKTTLLKPLSFALLTALSAGHAYAIKITVPEQYEEQVEALREAEEAQRERELRAFQGEDSATEMATDAEVDSATDGGLVFSVVDETEEAEGSAPAGEVDADEFLVQSLAEATATAGKFEKEAPEGQGFVSGQIVDQETGQSVPGVAILLEDTDIGTITDSEGRYTLGPAPADDYTISFIKSGYIEANVTEFAVAAGEVTVFPFALPPRPLEMSDEVYVLQDFTVTADEANQLMANLELRQDFLASMDLLGSEDFSRFGASDAADALKSVTGVSISGGKFAVVRGLDDRFSTTSLNGIVIPSPDPDRLAVPLDIFPSGLLQSVVTQKSFTADQPGESSGGAINLITKSHPEEFTAKISFGVASNENATGESNFLFADEQRFQPSPFRFAPRNKKPGLDTSFSSEIGGSFNVGDLEIGLVGGASYSEKYSHAEVERNRLEDDGGDASVSSSSIQTLSGYEEQLSGLFGASLRLNDVTTLSYTVLYAGKNEAEGAFSTIETESSEPVFETSASTVEREYWNQQLVLDHEFNSILGFEDVGLKLSFADSTNTQDEPDIRFSDTLETGDAPDSFDSTDFGQPVRYERLLEQEDRIFKIDVEVPYEFRSEEASVKFGFSNEDTSREVSQREFLGAQFDDATLDGMGGSNPDVIIIPDVLEFPGEPHFTEIPGTTVIDAGVAEGTREIRSVYFQSTFSPIQKIEVTAGVRMEDSFIEAVAAEPGRLTSFVFEPVVESSPIDEQSVLPTVNFTYDIAEDLQIRFGWSQTVAKPSFRELNPNPTFNPATGDAEIGNPGTVFQNEGTTDTVLPSDFSGLELVDVTNFDFRVEWFFTEEDLVSFSLFHKKVDGPIERIRVLTGGGSSFTFFNNDNEAEVTGAEFEVRYSLGNFSDFLQNLYIGGNYTYIDATVERSTLETDILPASASRERQLFNQPENIMNAFVNYRNEGLGLDATLSANQVGQQLSGVTSAGDIFIDPHLTLNFIVSWKVTENFSVKFSAKNLLDPKKERSYDTFGAITDPNEIGDAGGVADESTDFDIRDSYRSGRSFGVSASYSF
ncbi:MAG: TonB-dependent receptor [Verrucomicrobiota bacterium]